MADKLWNDPKFKAQMDKFAKQAEKDSKAGKKMPKPKEYTKAKKKSK